MNRQFLHDVDLSNVTLRHQMRPTRRCPKLLIDSTSRRRIVPRNILRVMYHIEWTQIWPNDE